jgi:hypothetical protein
MVDVAVLILRVVIGLLFMGHGVRKLFGWFAGSGLDGTGAYFESLGYRRGRRLALLAGVTEVGAGADFAAVTVHDREGRVERMYYAGMSHAQAAQIGDPPRGHGVLGRLGEADSPMRLDKISHHPHSVGFPPHHPPMDALLGVRGTSEGGIRVNLYVANGPGRPGFSERDEERVAALAAYARL